MRLLLIRHGESTANAEGRWQGHADFSLSERGRRESERLAERLAAWPIDALYTSPLRRARETEEEIGLRREHVEVWGQLDDIITVSNFIVSPYVGVVTGPSPYPFAPSAIEVAELLAVPLPHLHQPSSLNTAPAPWRERLVPPPSYRFGEHLIWGATARMLRQFLELTRPR